MHFVPTEAHALNEYVVHMLLSCLQKPLSDLCKTKENLVKLDHYPACQVLQDFDDLYI